MASTTPTISGIGGDGRRWVLIDKVTQVSVKVGEVRKDFRGKASRVTGGRPPKHGGSTGRIHVTNGGEFYPSVFGCAWVRI